MRRALSHDMRGLYFFFFGGDFLGRSVSVTVSFGRFVASFFLTYSPEPASRTFFFFGIVASPFLQCALSRSAAGTLHSSEWKPIRSTLRPSPRPVTLR